MIFLLISLITGATIIYVSKMMQNDFRLFIFFAIYIGLLNMLDVLTRERYTLFLLVLMIGTSSALFI